MFNFFHIILQKSAAIAIASVAAVFGFFGQPNTVVLVPPSPILILPAPPDLERPAGFAERGKSEPAPISRDPIQKISNATSAAIVHLTKNPVSSAIRISAALPRSPNPKVKIKPAAETPQPKLSFVLPPPSPAANILTVRMILDGTGFFLGQRPDGTYRLLFHTTTTAVSGFGASIPPGINWDLSEPSIGGAAPIPKLDVSFSCNPQPNTPSPELSDQSPIFEIDTSYDCAISLTDPLLRKESKEISFRTGAGRMVIKASNLNTVLKSNKSTNGFVLDNQSAVPITVTGLTFDISFTALNTSSPVTFRFSDPESGLPLAEYPLQDLPADSARPHANAGTNIKASFSFAVKPHAQRLFPIEIVGVQPLAIIGLNPEVEVTLRQIIIDHPDIKTAIISPTVSWSCIPYNPHFAAQGLPTEQNCK